MDDAIKKSIIFLWIMALALVLGNCAFADDTYKIDPTHSAIGFAVSHVEVGIVRGEFRDYSVEIEFDKDNPDKFSVSLAIKAKSLDTNMEARDNHLRGADFFDTEKYPDITFEAKKLRKIDSGYEIIGDLTIKGITKEVTAQAEILGPVKSPFGGQVIGIHGQAVINRRDFGITWNNAMPDGGFVVGNDVRIFVDIEADKK